MEKVIASKFPKGMTVVELDDNVLKVSIVPSLGMRMTSWLMIYGFFRPMGVHLTFTKEGIAFRRKLYAWKDVANFDVIRTPYSGIDLGLKYGPDEIPLYSAGITNVFPYTEHLNRLITPYRDQFA